MTKTVRGELSNAGFNWATGHIYLRGTRPSSFAPLATDQNDAALLASLDASPWSYAVDARHLYVPARIMLAAGQETPHRIGLAVALRDRVETVTLSKQTIEDNFEDPIGAFMIRKLTIWSAPLIEIFRDAGALYVAGDGGLGYWFAAGTEAEALSGLVGGLARIFETLGAGER